MRRPFTLPLLLALAITATWLLPQQADAIPAFARQVKQKCTYCHLAFPKLNEFGLIFKTNGYRLQGTEGNDVWQIPAWPVAAVAEIEGIWDDHRDGNDALTIEQPNVKVLWGANLGPRISTFGEIEVVRGEGADLGPAFLQVNDLVGEGQLNLKFGVYEVDFPFLAAARDILFDSYAAEELGFFPGVVGAELNGQLLPGKDEEGGLTVRYFAGVTLDRTDDIAADSQSDISGSAYATVSLTFMEQKLAAHYQHQAGDHADDDRWAVAAELTAMDVYLTLAYFDVSRDNDDPTVNDGDSLDGRNWMADLIYPYDDFVFGVRYDQLDNAGFFDQGDLVKWTAHASWYMRPNVQFGVELRRSDYQKEAAESSDMDDTTSGRLIARFGF